MIDSTLAWRLGDRDARQHREAERVRGDLAARVHRVRWWWRVDR